MKSVISYLLALVVCFGLAGSAIAADIYISEFQAVNDSTITDDFGDNSDWIELYNATTSDISLAGWYLTDDAGDLTKWQFPAITINAGDYLLVFASGENISDPQAAYQHTGFKISGSGEYLALVRPDGVTVEHYFNPVALSADVSYGLDQGGSGVLFASPTPGYGPGIGTNTVSPVIFSVAHGFYDDAFSLELSTLTAGATIRYTLNGDEPTMSVGNIYSGPIAISDTTVVRAAAFRSRMIDSEVIAQTYIFLDSVIQQGDDQSARDFPDIWDASYTVNHYGVTTGIIQGSTNATYRDADYEMDPDITGDSVYGPQMRGALLSIPTISMVMDVDDILGPQGIYPNSVMRASSYSEFEKPASLEWIDPAGEDDFTINCGSRIMGELARYPIVNAKQSFRVVFQEEYGYTKLKSDFLQSDDDVDKYDTLVLRANWGDGWLQDLKISEEVVSWYGDDATDNQYLRDMFAHDSYKDTGHIGVDGRFAHLYINGVYWGVYEVIERPDNNFHAQHFGGDAEDYDVIKGNVWDAGQGRNGTVQDGNPKTWNTLMSYFDVGSPTHSTWTGQNLTYGDGSYVLTDVTDAELAEIEKYLDIDAFIDYMVTLWMIDRGDFPKKNWYAVCKRSGSGGGVPEEKFRLYTWDSEASLYTPESTYGPGRWYDGSKSNDTGPVRMLRRLITNKKFLLRWTQRAVELLADDGILGAQANIDRYMDRVNEISKAIIAESARWGDHVSYHVNDPLNVTDHWWPEVYRITEELFPYRNEYVLQQMHDAGAFTAVEAPVFTGPSVFEGETTVNMSDPSHMGTIYYTFDGSDPMLADGSISPTALSMEDKGLVEIFPLGSVWSYDDTGTDYGDSWTEIEYDDSAWASGPAQLGYGDGDEDTLVGPGSGSPVWAMTTYFRRTFEIENADYVGGLIVNLLLDDGAVIYINGVEVARINMPAGNIGFDTPAASSIIRNDELRYNEYTLDVSSLVTGTNVIAVAVHQDAIGGSDLSFDMDMIVNQVVSPVIDGDTHVKARCLVDGDWSIYAERYYQLAGDSPLEITELYYHPEDPSAAELAAGYDADDFEFIELYNSSDYRTVEAAAVLGGGVDENIASFTMAPHEYAVLVADEDAFRMRFGSDIRILGDYSGRLSNAGENITLTDSEGVVIMDFAYSDASPWPMAADGLGMSLNLQGEKLYAHLPESWGPGEPTPGSEYVPFFAEEGDFNADGLINAADIDMLAAAIRTASQDLMYELEYDGVIDSLDMDYMINVKLGSFYGDANLDGVVDLDDFIILKQNMGLQDTSWSQGDFDGNGNVGLNDFILLKQNYGSGK